jgi:hypothetical protein
MKYILRAHTDQGMRFIDKVSGLIRTELGSEIEIVDHRVPNKEHFGIFPPQIVESLHVSLDRHLADAFGIDYFQISRVFNENGDVVNRLVGDPAPIIKKTTYTAMIHIIDTDMVQGKTMRLAKSMLGTSNYTVPVRLFQHEDLIDMEDLFLNHSLLRANNGIGSCNYLINPLFFSKRTSLPEELFVPMKEIVNQILKG